MILDHCDSNSKRSMGIVATGHTLNKVPMSGVFASGTALQGAGRDRNTGTSVCVISPGDLSPAEYSLAPAQQREIVMISSANSFCIFMTGVGTRIGPADEHEWRYHESLIQADFERCHPDDTFDDLKRRARFSKEDQGLLLDWMRLAAQRASERQESKAADAQLIAA